jgi:probable HAF family extracellular repeat protein
MKRHIFAAAFGALLVVLPIRHALRADAALYTVEDLGQFAGQAPTITGMNASGQFSGYVTGASGFPRAVRYTSQTGWEYVAGVSSFYSMAMGINDSGQLVGTQHDGVAFRAFRWVPGAGSTLIAPLPGGTMTFGSAIDNAGTVVGQSDSADGVRGFRAAGQTPVALPSIGAFATACGINAAGQIVGYGVNAEGRERAFRIEANEDVTEIVPAEGPTESGRACAIDAAGRVGGRSTAAGTYRGFVFNGTAPVIVDTFATSAQSNVESLSEGVAVGWFIALADGIPHAFVNTSSGSADLNNLIAPGTGWQLDQAFVVDAHGTIVGVGRLNGVPSAFRLTPVTPPDTTAPVIASLSASPSTIGVPNNAMVTVTVTVAATDDTDPAPVCSITGIDGHGAPATDFSVVGPLSGWVRARGGATYTFAVACSDASGNTAASSVDVVVPPDTTAPAITSVSANPSTIEPPNGALVPVTVRVTATDNVDAAPSCALSSVSVLPTSGPDDYATTGPLSATLRAVGGRTYTLVVTCRDAAGNASSSAVAVVVPPDTTAPVIESVTATPNVIWPPNGKMVNVQVAISATDNVDALPQCSVKAVLVTGGVASDGMVTGTYTASVRAEKDRSYTIKVVCRDAAGNASYGATTVVVANKDGVTAKNILQGKALLALLKRAAGNKAAANAKRYFSRGSSR